MAGLRQERGEKKKLSNLPAKQGSFDGEAGAHGEHEAKVAGLGVAFAEALLENEEDSGRRHVTEISEDARAVAELVVVQV